MAPTEPTIRVFLLDDHEVVRVGLAGLVDSEPDMTVVGQAGSGPIAINEVGKLGPDVAVLDIRLADGNGIAVCREIKTQFPAVSCLMLTSYADDQALLDAADAGASGYVLKQIRGSDLIDSIRSVAAGAQLLDAATVRLGVERLKHTDAGLLETLSPRERRVFDLIGRGHSNREIAEILFLAEKTVKNYVSSVLSKLGMQRRTEAAALAGRLDERRRNRYE